MLIHASGSRILHHVHLHDQAAQEDTRKDEEDTVAQQGSGFIEVMDFH